MAKVTSDTRITLGDYTLCDFEYHGDANGRVSFKIESVIRMLGEKDVEKIEMLISENLGKWENLVKSSFQLFYEIGIIDHSKNLAQIYKQPSGIELYEKPLVKFEQWEHCIYTSIALTQDEFERRRANHITPIMTLSEIETQLNSIPKWIETKRALENIKALVKT
jgi:hypothetical protein